MAKTRRYSLREERRRIQRENPPIEIAIDTDEENGEPEVFLIDAAPTWSDETLLTAAKSTIDAATLIIHGETQEEREGIYKRFHDAGGSAQLLFAIAGQTDQGADTGE
jgi:hypothetical protein